ncbi:MAG TPA: septal ring lytic transglycosylase RlpA family protein [Thermoanaerobaculia bacterium]|nr:septal ring lytic transglycosylase RlpA family protein [Thermoanaerobaculia bacterium]
MSHRFIAALAAAALLWAQPGAARSDCEHVNAAPEALCTRGHHRNLCLDPLASEVGRLATVQRSHRLRGTASYYSAFFDGRLTANGEIYRSAGISAAHLTLPLGSLVEVYSVATGRTLRLRVNDRGPYTGGFVVDLSRAAARLLGVDHAEDRNVEITVLSIPPPRGASPWTPCERPVRVPD